jgi:hypothetical protein
MRFDLIFYAQKNLTPDSPQARGAFDFFFLKVLLLWRRTLDEV